MGETERANRAVAPAAPPGIAVRRMTPADIPAAARLREQAGWNQTCADWQRLLAWAPDGCFVAAQAGRVVGTVTTTAYGSHLAWLGMLLVDTDLRRRGIGQALLAHAGAWLAQSVGVRTVALDATPLGQPLYERAGFVPAWGLQRWAGRVPRVTCPSEVRPLRATDRATLAALDRPAFGADRTGLLMDLVAAHPPGCFMLDGQAGRGYLCSRPGAHSWYLGPLAATEPAAAERLLHAALQPLRGEPVVLDVPTPNASAAALLTALGFAPQRPFLRMVRGPGAPVAARPEYFSIAGPEIG
ncbi:MAG: GNAT family N-acetyltransferase [Thermomicrobiales bacterium]